jgi:protein MpaA
MQMPRLFSGDSNGSVVKVPEPTGVGFITLSTRSYYTTPSWKKTALGADIELISSAPLAELAAVTNPRRGTAPSAFSGARPILLMGGIHGDEPEGVELAQQTRRWLESSTAELVPWIVIPCLNVDGFKQKTRTNGRGVDLNRNYPSRDWSPAFEKERYFPGPHAASEPEVQGVVELLLTLRPRLVIHCHSWEPCIVGTGAPAERDAKRLADHSGYKAVTEIGYPTPGSLSRFGWYDHSIPIICIEEQEGLTDLKSIWPRFNQAMMEIFSDHSLRTV